MSVSGWKCERETGREITMACFVQHASGGVPFNFAYPKWGCILCSAARACSRTACGRAVCLWPSKRHVPSCAHLGSYLSADGWRAMLGSAKAVW